MRDLNSGKIIDACEPDITPDKDLYKKFDLPRNIRIELTLKTAEEMLRRKGPDVAEIYSQPRVAAEATARQYGRRKIVPGWSLDLTMVKPSDNEPWDLSKEKKKNQLFELIDVTAPHMLIGSPPCTAYSALQCLNGARRSAEVVQKELREAREHIRTCCKAYEKAIS